MIKVIVNADEGDLKLRIEAKILGEKNLGEFEEAKIGKRLGRLIADAIRSIPVTDFGPENTTISIV